MFLFLQDPTKSESCCGAKATAAAPNPTRVQCAESQICDNGVCTCPTGQIFCSGQCIVSHAITDSSFAPLFSQTCSSIHL